MSDKDDIKELMAFKAKIEHDAEVKKDVDVMVKARCAVAYAWILGCTSAVFGLITLYSGTMKAASKAAIKVIVARILE